MIRGWSTESAFVHKDYLGFFFGGGTVTSKCRAGIPVRARLGKIYLYCQKQVSCEGFEKLTDYISR